ncbi:hypothetical protein Lal_00014047 [Lupinus albus]|nr:hypothetical protein Lal_00014047 [Lupinus albus]
MSEMRSDIIGLLASELDLNWAHILPYRPKVLTNPLATRVDLLRVDTILRMQILDFAIREDPIELNSSTWAFLNNPPVLPPNMGLGVFGSNSGGVNPTGEEGLGAGEGQGGWLLLSPWHIGFGGSRERWGKERSLGCHGHDDVGE